MLTLHEKTRASRRKATAMTPVVDIPTVDPSSRKTKAEDRIDLRLPVETKRVIELAAQLAGVSTSSFILTNTFLAAQHVVRGHDAWTLNRVQSRKFAEALMKPPAPNAALKAAANRYHSVLKGATSQ